MPKLNTFTLNITTGRQGNPHPPKYVINGFLVDFDQLTGGTGPGEILEATGEPGSFPHSLLLCGPREGVWEIDLISVTYRCQGEEPYTVRMGPATLDAHSDLSIWHERPAPVFDV